MIKDLAKIIGGLALASILIMALTISFGLFDLSWSKFYSPRKADIKRKVFESTQSYAHGKTQQLAKYFMEHRKASPEDKMAIEEAIRMQFAEFNVDHLNSQPLKNFLYQVRGF